MSASDSDLKDFYVLLMAAASLGPIAARNEHDAILISRHKSNEIIDPKKIVWMVKSISDKPFEIAEPDAEEPPEEPAPSRIVSI